MAAPPAAAISVADVDGLYRASCGSSGFRECGQFDARRLLRRLHSSAVARPSEAGGRDTHSRALSRTRNWLTQRSIRATLRGLHPGHHLETKVRQHHGGRLREVAEPNDSYRGPPPVAPQRSALGSHPARGPVHA